MRHAQICSRCGKNMAVIFVTKVENNETKTQGFCIKCAKELHIQPVEDLISKLGVSDDDIDNMAGELMGAMSSLEELLPNLSAMQQDMEDEYREDDEGKTADKRKREGQEPITAHSKIYKSRKECCSYKIYEGKKRRAGSWEPSRENKGRIYHAHTADKVQGPTAVVSKEYIK